MLLKFQIEQLLQGGRELHDLPPLELDRYLTLSKTQKEKTNELRILIINDRHI